MERVRNVRGDGLVSGLDNGVDGSDNIDWGEWCSDGGHFEYIQLLLVTKMIVEFWSLECI
jgi:hypothetical protein